MNGMMSDGVSGESSCLVGFGRCKAPKSHSVHDPRRFEQYKLL